MTTFITPGCSLVESALRERQRQIDAAEVEGVTPPGWERSVKRMKRDKSITNPWALAWWMKKHGAKPTKPSKKDEEADAEFDAAVAQALRATMSGFPREYLAASYGEYWAQQLLLGS